MTVHTHKSIPIKKFQNNMYGSLTALDHGHSALTVTAMGKPKFHVTRADLTTSYTVNLAKKEDQTPTEEALTIVNLILDKSGSMESIKNDTIGGFNNYLKELQKAGDRIRFTLTTFDTEAHRIATNEPVKNIDLLTDSSYSPNGGTALFDAVVDTVEDVAEKIQTLTATPKVLVVILTDGEENSSIRHNQDCYKELVEKLEKEGNWTFVYLGANQDSWANASKIGLERGNVMDWDSTPLGTQNAFASLTANTMAYAGSSMKSVINFTSLAEDLKSLKK